MTTVYYTLLGKRHQCIQLKYDVNHQDYDSAFGQCQPLRTHCDLISLVYNATIFDNEMKTL